MYLRARPPSLSTSNTLIPVINKTFAKLRRPVRLVTFEFIEAVEDDVNVGKHSSTSFIQPKMKLN